MNKNLKTWSPFLPILALGIIITPARADKIEPISVSCWLFRGDKVELQQTCIYESQSWAGGGASSLRWEDGVQTKMTWGLQGRGEKPCADGSMGIDGVCGVRYFRDSTTLKRISKAEREARVRKSEQTISCVQVQNKSVCWLLMFR